MEQFHRISRLPPYVFNIVNELKAKARSEGEDIIDFGMGNPDQPTPKHILKKIKALSQYESQKENNYFDNDFILGLAKVRGIQINIQYAEAFEIIRWII